MRKFPFTKTLAYIGLFCLATLLGTGTVAAVMEKGLYSGEAAGWVQAFGSIAAIAGAFWLAQNQHDNERKLDQERRDADERKRFSVILALLTRIDIGLKSIEGARASDRWMGLVPRETVLYLRETAPLFGTLPLFEFPHENLILLCNSVQREVAELSAALLEEERLFLELNSIPHALQETIRRETASLNQVVPAAINICNRNLGRPEIPISQ